MLVGVVVGILATALAGSLSHRVRPGELDVVTDPDGRVSILLVGADRERFVERQVDDRSGGLGFSHVVVDASETDTLGRRLVYDCFPNEGVRRVRVAERYGTVRGRPRPIVRVFLPPLAGAEMRGAVRAQLGKPYDLPAVVDPRRPGLVCSRLVLVGLPSALRDRIKPWNSRHPISPNDLARAFGVTDPYAMDVELEA